jgi:DNA-directed RNA polymerase II subunit RPB2
MYNQFDNYEKQLIKKIGIQEFNIIKNLFKNINIIKKQIESYNNLFIWLEEYIKGCKIGKRKWEITFSNVKISKPCIHKKTGKKINVYPFECKLRNLIYSGDIKVDCEITYEGKSIQKVNDLLLCQIPIMVLSNKCHLNGLNQNDKIKLKECKNELGGYLILNGYERVLISQEKIASNMIVIKEINKSYVAKIISEYNYKTKIFIIALKSLSKTKKNKSPPIIQSYFPSLKQKEVVPIFIILKVLGLVGVKHFKKICSSINSKLDFNQILKYFDVKNLKKTKNASLRFLSQKVVDYKKENIEFILKYDILPNIGTKKTDFKKKIYFICYLIIKFIMVVRGYKKKTDRDSLKFKRYEMCDDLMRTLFINSFFSFKKHIIKIVNENFKKQNPIDLENFIKHNLITIDLKNFIKHNLITRRLNGAIATGDWPGKRFGISQIYGKQNYLKNLSYLGKIIHPINTTSKQPKIRALHNTQNRYICPNETPEGEQTGLIKQYTMMSTVSDHINKNEILNTFKCFKTPITYFEFVEIYNNNIGYKLFINYIIIGFIKEIDFKSFIWEFIYHRRIKKIHFSISISYSEEDKEIFIWSDKGRILSPLIINIHNLEYKKYMNGYQNKEEFPTEYVDVHEEHNLLIGQKTEFNTEYTHFIIHESLILSIISGLCPFSDSNQSPRNIYAANQLKQTIGIPSTNYQERFDKRQDVLNYPQTAIIDTYQSKLSGCSNLPFGQNVVIAIQSMASEDQEDAIIMNKGSIDRGLFRSTTYITEVCEENENEVFQKPIQKKCLKFKWKKWKKWENKALPNITNDGIIDIGAKCQNNDILFGKIFNLNNKKTQGKLFSDHSKIFTNKNGFTVNKVLLTEKLNGKKLCKVKLSRVRIPKIGDKFSSRHGQKGVIGMIKRQEDMPFTKDGLTPDLIINPHCIPSRMTIGQLKEIICGKYASIKGETQDGTSFTKYPHNNIKSALKEWGYEESGKEVFYSGETGKRINAKIFVGIAYHMKLNHLVEDKIHARRKGPINILTRQPVQGKNRNGGLRHGEMERHCGISHGYANCLRDITFKSSDMYTIHVCTHCGLMAIANLKTQIYICSSCKDNAKIVKINLPYSFKLLLQELMAMSITPRIITDD